MHVKKWEKETEWLTVENTTMRKLGHDVCQEW